MNILGKKGKLFAFQCIKLQFISSMLCSIACGIYFQNVEIFKSMALGGLTCVVPSLYFANKFFKESGALAVKSIVNSFYTAEAIKLILTGLLFWFTFKYLLIRPAPFFMGYILAHLVFWVSQFLYTKKGKYLQYEWRAYINSN